MSRSMHTLPAGSGGGAVDSVNGETGTVVLDHTDVGAAADNHTHTGSWVDATLGTNISAGTAVTPGTRLEGNRVFLRGTLAWTAATIGGGSTLLTVAEAHRPATEKNFSIRTGPNSNVATQLHLNPDGTLTNETSFGTTTTADVGVDGFSWDLS